MGMETATLRPAHSRLARLAGAYAGPESVYTEVGGAAGEATGRFRTHMGLGGRFLVMDYQQEQYGSITRLVHAVLGFDASSDKCTLHWFDDLGEDPGSPALGEWHGDDLVFERVTTRGRVRLAFGAPLADGDALTLRMEASVDGAHWSPAMQGSYRRANWDRRSR